MLYPLSYGGGAGRQRGRKPWVVGQVGNGRSVVGRGSDCSGAKDGVGTRRSRPFGAVASVAG